MNYKRGVHKYIKVFIVNTYIYYKSFFGTPFSQNGEVCILKKANTSGYIENEYKPYMNIYLNF